MFQHPRLKLVVMAVALATMPLSHAAPSSHSSTPYAGQEDRDIKALSAQEVQALLGGRGMGFAKAAELNGYPGPAHVLELGDELALSTGQRQRTEALFESMERDAIALGEALVAAEREIDRLFAGGAVTDHALETALAKAGSLQAKLRGVHLRAHVEQVQILDAAQIERYAILRGYRGQGGNARNPGAGDHGPHHEHGGATHHQSGQHSGHHSGHPGPQR